MISFSPRHTPITLLLLSAALCTQQADAQDSAAVQRSLEQSLRNLPPSPAAPQAAPVAAGAPVLLPQTDIANLAGVMLDAPPEWADLSQRVQRYWADSVGRTVSARQLEQFNVWLWQQLNAQGYLGFIALERETDPAGERLMVKVSAPRVAAVSVLTLGSDASAQHGKEVAQRLKTLIPQGSLLDIRHIEKQLEGISFDLPVRLDARVRQLGGNDVDVVIEIKDIEAGRWAFSNGLVQLNNQGLPAFGREQLLAVGRWRGPRPQSELALVSQVSQGVRFARSEYSEPWRGMATRWNVFASVMDNEVGLNRGSSAELGFGLNTLLSTTRHGTVQSLAEVSQRQAQNKQQGLGTLRSREDSQLRLGLLTSHSWDGTDSLTTRTVWSVGELDLRDGDVFKAGDANLYRFAGIYRRLETSGSYAKTLDAQRQWSITARWRAQWADKNLDTFNQIGLGGVNGIRAFASDEGVGDQGGLVSVDLVRNLSSNWWTGVFYDAGRVRALKNPLSVVGNTYDLRGAGLVLGGNAGPWSWSFTAARSMGDTPVLATAIRGNIGDWRGWASVTRRF